MCNKRDDNILFSPNSQPEDDVAETSSEIDPRAIYPYWNPVPSSAKNYIEARIAYHATLALNLQALLQALPQNISREAEQALIHLLELTRPPVIFP